MENSKDDIVSNTLDVIEIISKNLKDFRGTTGTECDECECDCEHKALQLVKLISEKYIIVKK